MGRPGPARLVIRANRAGPNRAGADRARAGSGRGRPVGQLYMTLRGRCRENSRRPPQATPPTMRRRRRQQGRRRSTSEACTGSCCWWRRTGREQAVPPVDLLIKIAHHHVRRSCMGAIYIFPPLFQNIGRFDFFRFIYFVMYLVYRCIANTMNLEKPKRPTFWNGEST